jgi:anhydro-N-acetylmuramic acid kinase
MLIDAYCHRALGTSHDERGAMAAHGEIRFDLLERLMRQAYLKRKPSKSTGREEFGEVFLEQVLRITKHVGNIDLLATLTEFTALSIYDAATRFVPRGFIVDEVIASGGGIHNATLMRSLAIKFAPALLQTSDSLGVPSHAKEAMLMAVLANETVNERPANVPRATGAKKPVVLGKICL